MFVFVYFLSTMCIIYKSIYEFKKFSVGLVGTAPTTFREESNISVKRWSLVETSPGVFSDCAITLQTFALCPLKYCSARRKISVAPNILLLLKLITIIITKSGIKVKHYSLSSEKDNCPVNSSSDSSIPITSAVDPALIV